MKKLILALSCLIVTIGLCSCGGKKEPEPVPELDPAQLITAEDVAAVAGYTPVVVPEGTAKNGNRSSVLYRSEPIGKHDTVEVKLVQFNDDMPYQQIFSEYEANKAKRSDAKLVDSLGQEAYIAFPTIYVYDRGCLLSITAGSGADDEQERLLKNLAFTAVGKLEEQIPEYNPDKK